MKKMNKESFISLIILYILNLLLNGGIELKGLFMDDLFYWKLYHLLDTKSFIFNTEMNKIRPVSNLIQLVGYKFTGYQTEFLDLYLLIINYISVIVVFWVIYKICGSKRKSLIISIVYLFSSFSYYYIGQYFGVMESMGLIFSILTLYYMYEFINSCNKAMKFYIFACISTFLAVFTHERYLCLMLFLIFGVILKFLINKDIKCFLKYMLMTSIQMFIILSLRIYVLGNRAFDGTGGSDILNEFNVGKIIKHFIMGILSLLGINANEAYLNGISVNQVNPVINIMSCIFILIIFILILKEIKYIIARIKQKNIIPLANNMLYLSFIGLTLLSGCVTIRLESRWLYTPFTGFLMLFSYWLKDTTKKQQKFLLVSIILFTMPVQVYYRGYYKFVYFSGRQAIYNELYTTTINKYNDELYKRPIILVEEEEIFIYEQEIIDFYTQYKYNEELPNPNIFIYRHLNEIPKEIALKNPIVILIDSYNPNDGFKKQVMDITREYNYLANAQYNNVKEKNIGSNLKEAEIKKGYYSDGWCENELEFIIRTENEGKIILKGYYPKDITGKEVMDIYIKDKLVDSVLLQQNNFNIILDTESNKEIKVKIKCNFKFLADLPDIRCLSFILFEAEGI